MDMIQMLKDDHAKVRSEIQQLLATAKGQETEISPDKIRSISEALMIHMKLEEEHLYPVMGQFDETRDLVRESFKEHQQVKDILGRLNRGETEWVNLQADLRRLLDAVDHHVQEEESELFPTTREKLSEQEINRIGDEMMQLKQREMAKKAP